MNILIFTIISHILFSFEERRRIAIFKKFFIMHVFSNRIDNIKSLKRYHSLVPGSAGVFSGSGFGDLIMPTIMDATANRDNPMIA
jgi:hypothetical protein